MPTAARPCRRTPAPTPRAITLLAAAGALLLACGARQPAANTPARDAIATPPRDPSARLAAAVRAAREAFRRDAALELVRVADRGFRARGNQAYVATLAAVEAHLRAAGFAAPREPSGATPPDADAVVARETLHSEAPIWDARAAALELVEPARERLMGFDARDDAQRTMLVAYTPGGEVTGELVRWHPADDLPAAQIRPETSVRGRVVLTDEDAGSVARQAARAGALAVLSGHTEAYNDPAGHPDAVRYSMFHGEAPPGLLQFNLSPAVYARLASAVAHGKVVVHLRADATLYLGRTETLVARVEGREPGAAPVVLAAHADEPGANDNGSGVGGLAEAAATYLRLIRSGRVARPARPVVFLFGMEIEQSMHWLELHPAPRPVFALVADMIGEGRATAPMLVERMPDPGATRPRGDDRHSSWWSDEGASTASPSRRRPGAFLTAYVLAALGAVDPPRWVVRDHPYEGGSDHIAFLARGIPAVLLWHFPDDAYHTSRDRLARVDGDEIARVAAGMVGLVAHAAAGDEATALDVLGVNERYAHARLAREAALSRAAVLAAAAGAPRAGVRAAEVAHLGAWGRHFDEALASSARLAVAAQPTAAMRGAVDRARARVAAAVDAATRALP